MLNRKSQGLDLQEGGLADQADERDTQGICCAIGVEASAQAPEGMSMVDFNLELTEELCIHPPALIIPVANPNPLVTTIFLLSITPMQTRMVQKKSKSTFQHQAVKARSTAATASTLIESIIRERII